MATPNFGLGNQVNQFMAQQVRAPYLANLPNYASMVGQRSRNVGGFLRGEVPQDVTRLLQQRGAERGVATGMTGGPNLNASWLQALGLTSLGLMDKGSQQLTQSIADTPVPQPWNPIDLYLAEREQEEAVKGQKGIQGNSPWSRPDTGTWQYFNRGSF